MLYVVIFLQFLVLLYLIWWGSVLHNMIQGLYPKDEK